MPDDFSRAQRLGEQVKRELALVIQRELRDPRLGMVTVNFVDLSKDLSHASVNVTILTADDEETGIYEALTLLNRASSFLRTELGRVLKIRRLPYLRFFYDDSLKKSAQINTLIHAVRRGN